MTQRWLILVMVAACAKQGRRPAPLAGRDPGHVAPVADAGLTAAAADAAQPPPQVWAPALARTTTDLRSHLGAAPNLAILHVVARGNLCVNSIHESIIGEVVDTIRGQSVHFVFAHDDNIGFPKMVGPEGLILVAAVTPAAPQTMTLVDECSSLRAPPQLVDGTTDAFFIVPDLAAARALARTLTH